jgi:hypothetical protein
MRAEVVVELDRKRVMVLDFAAMKAFTKARGKKIHEADEGDPDDQSALIWCSLLDDDPDITIAQVDKLLHIGNIGYVSNKFAELFGGSMPEPDGQTKN